MSCPAGQFAVGITESGLVCEAPGSATPALTIVFANGAAPINPFTNASIAECGPGATGVYYSSGALFSCGVEFGAVAPEASIADCAGATYETYVPAARGTYCIKRASGAVALFEVVDVTSNAIQATVRFASPFTIPYQRELSRGRFFVVETGVDLQTCPSSSKAVIGYGATPNGDHLRACHFNAFAATTSPTLAACAAATYEPSAAPVAGLSYCFRLDPSTAVSAANTIIVDVLSASPETVGLGLRRLQ